MLVIHPQDADRIANSVAPDKTADCSLTLVGIVRSGPEVIFFSCSTELSMKFEMRLIMKISGNSDVFELR